MSSVNGLDNTQPTSPLDAAHPQGSNKLGKDEFLRLLMAQLGHQDPTAPTDSGAFVAQLAQFAGLEATQNTNDTLQNLLMGQAANQQVSVINMVGKDVTFRTDHVTLADKGSPASATATLEASASKVSASIIDASGSTVRTIDLGAHNPGSFTVAWDGRDAKGGAAPAGSYTIQINATNTDGKPVTVSTATRGQVSGISFDSGGAPSLIVGGEHIKLSDVSEIKERNTP